MLYLSLIHISTKEIGLTGTNGDDDSEDERLDFCVASINKSDIENQNK